MKHSEMKETKAQEMKEPKAVEAKETEKHAGFYKGPKNQTILAGHVSHADGKKHEDHHPAVKMSKGGK
jgi:hypothetical protein